ncbi:MAG TPA: M48 family peptidase [Campylobacteraceae bacterium]|nr:M48 family peptidase [Campylobacteraceae bacterium]
MAKIVHLSLVMALSLFWSACSKTPYTNRNQVVIFSPQQELQMGYQAAREILTKERVSRDPRLNAVVQRVGKRIAQAAAQPGYKWQFFVIDKDVPNAFCLPGGKVFVYSGLFRAVRNEDQLATVIGHEVAHAIARHGAERMSMIQLGRMGKQIAAQAIGAGKYGKLIDQAYGIGETYGMVLPYSRKFEYEADEIGLYLMTKAGYDPRESLKFWQNMMRLARQNRKPPEFLSTHPSDTHRIERLKRLIPKALKYYR